MTAPNLHFPAPGPDYWDWKCLRCDQPVKAHELRWWKFWRKEGAA